MPISAQIATPLAAVGELLSNPLFLAGALCGLVGIFFWVQSRFVTTLGRIDPIPLERQALPRDFADHATRIEAELRPLGFQPAGDYQLVHGKNPEYVRFYAGSPPHVFAEFAVYRKMAGGPLWRRDARILTFTTLLTDGTCVQTGNVPLPDGGRDAPPGMYYASAVDVPAAAMLAAHAAHVARCTAASRAEPYACPPQGFARITAEYMRYQREHFAHLVALHLGGDAPPPVFPRLPTAADDTHASCNAAAAEVHDGA